MSNAPFPTGEPTTPATPEGGSDLDARITDSVQRAMSPALQAIGNNLQHINQRLSEPPPDPKPVGEPANALWADPDAYIQSKAVETFNARAQEHLVPFMENTVKAAINLNLSQEQARFDAKYGEGMFDKHVRPTALQIISASPLEKQVDPNLTSLAVQSVMGGLTDTLYTLRHTRETAPKPEPDEMLSAGGGRYRPKGDTLPTEAARVLAEWNHGGGLEITAAEMLDSMKRGNSLDDWSDLKRSA
jgi:hypothetical protein